MKSAYTKPPYSVTPRMLELVAMISEKLGEVKGAYLHRPPAELRKRNRIKTIHSSLEIEGNTLSVEQITALLDGKRVLAPEKDILEVRNAIKVYDALATFKPFSLTSMLGAHKILMTGLVERAGELRGSTVGIVKGGQVAHIAPPADIVRALLTGLLDYLKSDPDIMLIKSCVFHYEFEFIHPFTDGNGRMGRLWQTVILRQYNPVFEFLPVETLIRKRQREYYDALERSDKSGHSTPFIEFMLEVVADSLEELLGMQNVTLTAADRIELFRREMLGRYAAIGSEVTDASAVTDGGEVADGSVADGSEVSDEGEVSDGRESGSKGESANVGGGSEGRSGSMLGDGTEGRFGSILGVGSGRFSRADYIRHFKTISTATATRDLRAATENGILEKFGDGRSTEYKFRS